MSEDNDLNKIDYSKLGFKAGLEIHQQLDSHKLFCNCPSLLRQDEPDFEVSRRLHAVAGESGEVDIAAMHEASLDKEFIYQGYGNNVCLIDLDEEPPHEINKDALKTALHIALLLNCKIETLTQIMRKTVIDGSNTTGFQRTIMIARDGYVETSFGRVGILGMYLEEDAARIIGKEKGKSIFRLDRLGIPLVEIATKPDIKNAEQAKETALKIGEILRACKVKRGIGTIRQDVNMSIKGGERIEIKGFQDIRNIEKTIEKETKRQIKLVKENKSVSEVRNALADGSTEYLRPVPGSARMYPETDLPLLKIHKNFIDEAKKTLPRLREEVEEELKKRGLHEEMIKLLFQENKIEEFKQLLHIYDNANFVVKVLVMFLKDISRRENKSLEEVGNILEDSLADILNAVKKKKISENDVKDVMTEIVRGKSLEEAIKIEKADLGNIEERIANLIKSKPGLSEQAYMGLIMQEFKGKIEGKEAREIIRKYVK